MRILPLVDTFLLKIMLMESVGVKIQILCLKECVVYMHEFVCSWSFNLYEDLQSKQFNLETGNFIQTFSKALTSVLNPKI